MKNEKSGFSLIEVLIALIIISLVTSAMAPVISKKLIATGAFITVKGGGSAFCDAGQYLEDSGSCADCPKGFFCVNNEKIQCLEGQISDVAQSACTTCENGFYANETQDKCIKCEAGNYCTQGKKTTCPDGSISTEGQYFCTSCPEGYYCQNGEQKSCESKFTNCTTCTQSTCLACKSGYEIENKTCVLKGFSQAFCDSLGSNLLYLTASQNGGTAACVTKANVGDTYAGGPEISSSAGVTVVAPSQSCGSGTEKCCWIGNNVNKTSYSCSVPSEKQNGNSEYSGCTRTLCNWMAAKAACETWAPSGSNTKGKWRLPLYDELSAWSTNASIINTGQGKNGLQACSGTLTKNVDLCGDGNQSCTSVSGFGYCVPNVLWALDEYSSYQAKCHYIDTATYSSYTYNSKQYAFSARCVLDEDTYFNRMPKTLTSQADCDKFGKNLLFLTASQNGGKAACVTKANVGDTYAGGPEISPSAGITVVNATSSCGESSDDKSKCCWLGNNVDTTAVSCGDSGNGDSTYSGCKRTVCTWAAAKAACENWESVSGIKGKWRLPTRDELYDWSSNFSAIQKNQGKNGLELCDYFSKYGSIQCSSGNDCSGTPNGQCNPDYVWLSNEASPSSYAYHFYLFSGGLSQSTKLKNYANSARCVLDEDAVKSL